MPAALLIGCSEEQGKPPATGDSDSPDSSVESVDSLVAERERLDATLFAPETDAQRYEQAFVALWDDLRSKPPFEVLRNFEFGTLVLGSPKPQLNEGDWGVEGIRPAVLGEPSRTLPHADYVALLNQFESAGWKIAQTEWHHSQFYPAKDGEPARSLVSFEIHAMFQGVTQPLVIRGKLAIRWRPDGTTVPDEIATRDVELIARKGEPMFASWLDLDPKVEVPGRFPRTSPILVHDLDGDGLSEIVAAGCNLVYWNLGGTFERRDFLDHPVIQPAEAGILVDLTGDGIRDYVTGSAVDGTLLLFKGAGQGRFPDPPVTCFDQTLKNLHTLTAGDIDRDGDLDLFLGQWKRPYAGGAMPTPYYDANDGYPDYLLRNEGDGTFTDITESSGLAPLRNRRTFSASLVDLDGDHHLDLAVVADFSGLDLYRNKGDGTFENATDQMVKQRHGFGMSHTFGDWNADGELDLYMVGMSSTTARRLDGLGLGRPGYEKYDQMRAPMTFGNRLYAGNGQGSFEEPAFAASAARTGWSWGCTSADFDLDGDSDLYVANGHLSGDSAKDYCTRFWCHDLYTGDSRPDPILNEFFTKELGMKLGTEYSWNGFEHNALFLNRPNEAFLNASFLLGVAFEYDSRAVVSEDLDADGRPDLLVVEYRTDTMSQRLHVYRNQYESGHHWIGLRLPETFEGEPVAGAVVRVRSGERVWMRAVVTGDSFTAQHSSTVHFGLGEIDQVDAIEIEWASGKETVLPNPSIDGYHTVPGSSSGN